MPQWASWSSRRDKNSGGGAGALVFFLCDFLRARELAPRFAREFAPRLTRDFAGGDVTSIVAGAVATSVVGLALRLDSVSLRTAMLVASLTSSAGFVLEARTRAVEGSDSWGCCFSSVRMRSTSLATDGAV